MEDFIYLTTVDGIEAGGMKTAELEGHHFLIANFDGEYFVSDARCPHMGASLSRGELAGTVLTCPLHHSQFDLRDGRCLRWTDWEGITLGVGKLLRHPRSLRTYEVRVDGSDVYVGHEKPQSTSE